MDTMLTFSLLLGLVSLQGEVIEFKFKHAKAAYVMREQSQALKNSFPDLRVIEKLAEAPSTGPWLFVDKARNVMVVGSRDSTAEEIAKVLREYDVAPLRVQLVVEMTRPGGGITFKSVCEATVGMRLSLGNENLGATVSISPHLTNDMSFSLRVGLSAAGEHASCVARLAEGSTFQIIAGKGSINPGPKPAKMDGVTLPPAGKVWEPFQIKIRPTILAR